MEGENVVASAKTAEVTTTAVNAGKELFTRVGVDTAIKGAGSLIKAAQFGLNLIPDVIAGGIIFAGLNIMVNGFRKTATS
jgi:hypothetical protein